MKSKILRVIGFLLMIISFVFIAKKISNYKLKELNFGLILQNIYLYILIVIILTSIVIFSSILYYNILRRLNGRDKYINIYEVAEIYCKSNLYKYIPGNVVQYIGRNQLAIINRNISHVNVIKTTIIEMFFIIVSSLIISLIFSGKNLIYWILNNVNSIIYYIIVIIILVVILIIIYYRKKLFYAVKDYYMLINKQNIIVLLLLFCSYIIIFLIQGIVFYSILNDYSNNSFGIALFINVIGLYSLSWIAGYITPGVPGGIGIREGMMCLFLNQYYPDNILLSVVLISRILSIVGDLTAYVLSLIIFRIKDNQYRKKCEVL